MGKSSARALMRLCISVGLVSFGWLFVGFAIYVYLTKVEIIRVQEVVASTIILLTAAAFWWQWARPKMREGRDWMVMTPILTAIALAAVVYFVWLSTLAELVWAVASGVVFTLLGLKLHTRAATKHNSP
jgi:hypothetical protein